MKFEFEIPEAKINEAIECILEREIREAIFDKTVRTEQRIVKRLLKEAVSEIMKNYKDEIVNKIVDQCKNSVTKKAVVELLKGENNE